jgi:hypothetical protein
MEADMYRTRAVAQYVFTYWMMLGDYQPRPVCFSYGSNETAHPLLRMSACIYRFDCGRSIDLDILYNQTLTHRIPAP